MTALADRAGATHDTDRGWRGLDPIDRSWSGVWYVRAYLDIDMPTPERLREALWSLSVQTPAIGRWLTITPPRWRPVRSAEKAEWLDRVVRYVDEADVSAERAFAENADPLAGVPFRIVHGPNWISVRQSHATGDGWTVNAFVGHLLRRASGPAAATLPWTTVSPRRRDLMIAKDVATHLGPLAWAVRHREELAGGAYEAASERADEQQDLSVALVSGPELIGALRAIRDEHFPGASAAAVAKVGFRAAFASVLPEPLPGFECLFNTRTKELADAWGNWSVGVYVTAEDDYSPLATTRAMARARDMGLPGLAAASLRARARRSAGDTVQLAAQQGAPRLTLSYTQSHGVDGMLPGVRDGRTYIATLTRPNGLDTIAVHALEVAGRLSVSASFYPGVWAREAVVGALEAFLADPAAYLIPGRTHAVPTGAERP